MLNYKNDPLLLNQETVNDLISDNKNFIFLDNEKKILNLYSAFVKKSDFIRKEKICQPLQKTVYVKVSDKLKLILQEKSSNNKEMKKLIENYIGKRSIGERVIEKWFNKNIFPFILLRILSENEKELAEWTQEIEYFTDFLNKSRFKSPLFIEELLNPQLIYLAGCSLGDGHIDKACKRWTLVDGSSDEKRLKDSKKFVEKLTLLTKNYVNKTIIKEHTTKFDLRINNKPYCRFLNFFFGLPIGSKKKAKLQVPKIIYFSENDVEKYFWRGCFDTDGSVLGSVGFSSSDKNMFKECERYLLSKEIKITFFERSINIPVKYIKRFVEIGFAHPRKQKELIQRLKITPKLKSVKEKNDQKIDSKLRKIYKVLRTDKDGYRIRVNKTSLEKSDIDIEEVKKVVKEKFNYEIKIASNDLYYFKSKKVYNYLQNLFIYEPEWRAINGEESKQLLNDWNIVWKK
ncbi:MAG: LAGLIDADG family homing endonuclease [archaeon]